MEALGSSAAGEPLAVRARPREPLSPSAFPLDVPVEGELWFIGVNRKHREEHPSKSFHSDQYVMLLRDVDIPLEPC